MKRWTVLSAVGMVALSLSMSGCDDSSAYSPAVRYQVRTDPLVLSDKLGEETFTLDRPGIFPMLAITDLQDPRNPLHASAQKLINDDLIRDPLLVPKAQRATMAKFLSAHFGTPAQPRVLGVSEEITRTLKIDGQTLAQGSSLYRIHCLHCHGVTGDGRGPTAKWVNPHPRDYRQGLFKFQSVDASDGANDRPPGRDDLLRVLRQGIEGTAMPSFNVLPEAELEALVSYVIHLSIRGSVEYRTIAKGFDFDPKANKLTLKEDTDLKELMRGFLTDDEQSDVNKKKGAADKWFASQFKKIKVEANPAPPEDREKFKESVLRGQQLFLGQGRNEAEKIVAKNADCQQCHLDYGRRAKFRFDSWGTYVKPNNLTQGIYRGGRRPVDVYYRIHSGINGSNMKIFGGNEKTNLTNADIWDLVNFVQVLPYPAMRQSLGIDLE